MAKNPLFIILFTAVLLSSCGRQTSAQQDGGDTVSFKYARRLTVVRHDGYTVVTLANPWKEGKTLHRYLLVPKGTTVPDTAPEGCTVIRTPLSRSVVFTTVHCALLMMMQQQQCIAGVADLKYIKVPYIQEAVRRGAIMDCGDGMSPVIERIIDLRPDAIFLSPFENSGGYGKLEDIDIPLVECAEYMETSPLARAEWMRFYGMLLGEEQKTDSLFAVVDSSYHALCQQAAKAGVGRSVLIDKIVGSVWYVPGGHSTLGQMVHDAAGRYPWADDEHSGSLSLPFETVLERAGDAEVWIYRYSGDHDQTYDELLSEHRGYDQLQAYRNREVFGCNVETTPFYEETPFRPDYLLSDFINILHPGITNMAPLRYYKRLMPKE